MKFCFLIGWLAAVCIIPHLTFSANQSVRVHINVWLCSEWVRKLKLFSFFCLHFSRSTMLNRLAVRVVRGSITLSFILLEALIKLKSSSNKIQFVTPNYRQDTKRTTGNPINCKWLNCMYINCFEDTTSKPHVLWSTRGPRCSRSQWKRWG